jgi:hypothetical protein
MSSNRLIYDKCAYAAEIKESTGSLEYNLFKGKYENCTQCPTGDFTNNLEFGSRADTESELQGLNRPGTLCPSLKYDPSKKFANPSFSPARMCQSIYYITPNNLEKPTTNMLNENNLGLNSCEMQRK